MVKDRLEQIRERAYALWEQAGGGHGQDQAHWHQASVEIDAKRRRVKKGRAGDAQTPASAPTEGAQPDEAGKVRNSGKALKSTKRGQKEKPPAMRPEGRDVTLPKKPARACSSALKSAGPASRKASSRRPIVR
jgi:hypothetical protein